MNTSSKQFDFFSNEQSLWPKQWPQRKKQLHDQLAQLLLSCLTHKQQTDKTQKEDQSCQEK